MKSTNLLDKNKKAKVNKKPLPHLTVTMIQDGLEVPIHQNFLTKRHVN
jgi:hypothetical protein